MKNILITQIINKNKHNDIIYQVEKNWYDFFKNSNVNLITLDASKKIKKKKISAIILQGGGGNDLPNFFRSKENNLRKKYDLNILKYALKKNIPILAVCYGFQLIADYYKANLIKVNNHIRKKHLLIFNTVKKKEIKIYVNSFHNYGVFNLPKFFNEVIKCNDKSIEYAKSNKKNIMCMMFHPERKNCNQLFLKKLIFSHLKI
jgi:gamma-glutamyl-gamma-aminobutyrate hydrolase PuuD